MRGAVSIKKIDKHGWLGRTLHPEPRHEGRMALVESIEKVDLDEDDTVDYYLIRATTLTGERLELMEHEIEWLGPDSEQPGYTTV
ncbi:MAG: hypothetical protein EBR82_00065 [Caulobacteraceae bacterium]|nr:hypothetical protein [Caulobacteraceae bacterium]